jgi:tetratricopeptide (TPR) repeat protein
MEATKKRFSFDTAAAWVLMFSVALSVVLFTPTLGISLTPMKVSVVALGFLLALILYVLARLTRGNVIVPPLALLGALWLVPLAYALSTLFSGAGLSASFFGTNFETDTFGFILILAAVASLTALVFRKREQFSLGAFVVGGTLGILVLSQALIVLASRVFPGSIAPTQNLIGAFIDLGMLSGLAVVLALITLRFLTLTRIVRIAVIVGLVLGLFVLGAVNAPALWIITGLASLALFIEAIMKRRHAGSDEELEGVSTLPAESDTGSSGSRSVLAPLGVLIVSFFFVIGGNTLGASFTNALGTSIIDARPSWQATFDIGSRTYASSPLFGSGPGTFGEQWLKFRDRTVNDTIFWNIDFTSGIGFIPTSLVTTGIIGAIAWLLFLGLLVFFAARALLFRLPQDTFLRFVSVASFTGTLYVLAFSVFNAPGPIVLTVGFFLLGIFISSLRFSGERKEWGVLFSKSPRVGFVIVFCLTLVLLGSVVGAYGVLQRFMAEISFKEASDALASGDLVRAEEAAQQSLAFSPSDRTHRVLASVSIARMNQIATDNSIAPTTAQEQFQAALTRGIEAGSAATTLNPNNYQNWALLGSVYQTVVPLQIEGAYQSSRDSYDRAVALNPTNPVLPFVLAQLEITNNNGAQAETELLNAIGLKRDYAQAIYLLSQLQVSLGKSREALEAAEAAAYFAPNDPVVLFQLGLLRSGNGQTEGAIAALTRAIELNPQYANAHFFLGVMLALQGDLAGATSALQMVASFSEDNAQAVQSDLEALQKGQNPFPPSRLGALGIPQVTVTEPVNAP